MRLGGVALRETGEQVLKRLSKEADHIGKAIGAQAEPFTKAITKEMDEAPYKIPDWENWYRNDLGRVQKEGMDLMQDASNKQSLDELQGTLGKNKPQPEVEKYQTQKLIEGQKARKGNQKLINEGRSKEEVTSFGKTQKAQEAIGSHHHIDDLKFIGDATNRADRDEVLKIVQELRPGTVFGDRKAGLIGAMDQKTFDFRTSAREDIGKQIEGFDQLPKDKQTRLLNDLQKEAKDTGDDFLEEGEALYKVNKQYDLKTSSTKDPDLVKRKPADFADPTDPDSYGLPRGEPTYRGKGPKARQKGWKVADTWPDGRPVTIDDRRSAYLNRLDRLNIDRQKIKYDPSKTILPKDHLDIIHTAGYNSPKFKAKREIEALMESGEWLTKTPREAAEMIVEVMDTHRKIVMNVSVERLRMIKEIIEETEDKAIAEVILAEPQNIRRWVEENLQKAANVGWKKKIPTFEELTTTPKLKPGELEEVNAVFATELASIPEKVLQEVSPGIMASPDAAKDPAMKAVMDRLAQDPTSLDASGMGTRFNVNQMK